VKVLLDVDGVLANFIKGAYELHNKPDPYAKEENLGSYEIQDLLNIHGRAFWDLMGETFWANLDLMPNALEILEILESQYGSHNICLLTSPVKTPGCLRGKMRWIEQHLPEYSRRFLIGPAKEFCAHQNSILFDDFHRNIEKFDHAGGNTFLIPAPWNAKHQETPVLALLNFLGGINV